MLESVVPSANQKAIYSFDMGQGRSPSYFFFTDNRVIMIKTMKSDEVKILFDSQDGIIVNYMKHISEQPDSLLSKIFGVY